MIANAFRRLATPPYTFSASVVKKNVHLFYFSHSFAKSSSTNISPMAIPKPASNT